MTSVILKHLAHDFLLLTSTPLTFWQCHNVYICQVTCFNMPEVATRQHDQVQTATYLGVSQSVIRNMLTHFFTNWHDARWTLKRTSMDNITCAILILAYCFIKISCSKHRTATQAVIKKWNKIINTNSAQLTHDAGLRAQQPYVGLPFTGRHWQARLVWAKQHQCWTNQMWGTILFTGESHFLVDVLDRQRQVWHQLEERLARCA